jgi:hypothetical protein
VCVGAADMGERVPFLQEARKRGRGPVQGWRCVACGRSFAPQDVLITGHRDPECPTCHSTGWETMTPRSTLQR